MAKIQIQPVEMTTNVEMIPVNSYLISKCIRAQVILEKMQEDGKRFKRKYNDEEKKYEDVLDENGNKIVEYSRVDFKDIDSVIVPLINELVSAFEGAQ